MRVFIVDDERAMVQVFREILGRWNIDVVGWAYDGVEATQTYDALPVRPDVTIMDYRLPGKNGIQTMEEIHERDPAARVLFVSADSTAKNAALAAGAIGFMGKPFPMEKLRETMLALTSGGDRGGADRVAALTPPATEAPAGSAPTGE